MQAAWAEIQNDKKRQVANWRLGLHRIAARSRIATALKEHHVTRLQSQAGVTCLWCCQGSHKQLTVEWLI